MPNKERGKVSFQYQEKEYILCLTFNAFAQIESYFDNPIHEVMEICFVGEKPKLGFRELRMWFLGAIDNPANREAGLFNGTQSQENRMEFCGEIIDALGGFMPANKLIVECIAAAFPKDKATEKKAMAKDGIGPGS